MRSTLFRAPAHCRVALSRAIHWSFGKPPRREVAPIPEGSGPIVSIVFGSFESGRSKRDAHAMYQLHTSHARGLRVREPQSGHEFDFNLLQATDILILCCSSQTGYPPANLVEFAHQLQLAAETGDAGCLGHLRHAVWGNGDARWFDTFMNVPRTMDVLLEACGSRRFYARGEAGEPHAPTRAQSSDLANWAAAMWAEASTLAAPVAAAATDRGGGGDRTREAGAQHGALSTVTWDAQWSAGASPHHHAVTPWALEALVRRNGELQCAPSVFAKPETHAYQLYQNMLERVREEARMRQEEQARRRAARTRAKAGTVPPKV